MTDHNRDGGPAFPRPDERGPDGCGIMQGNDGMSLRDWFAGQALGTLIHKSEDSDGGWDVHSVAAGCYAVADAMLSARSALAKEEA